VRPDSDDPSDFRTNAAQPRGTRLMENTDLTLTVLHNLRADIAMLGGRVDKL
jgi:hypothetical protein